MKQILQVKRRKIPGVPASAITSSKAHAVQQTLHPLFTVTLEQREAANRQRFRALLAQEDDPPGASSGGGGAGRPADGGQRSTEDGGEARRAPNGCASGSGNTDRQIPSVEEHRSSTSRDEQRRCPGAGASALRQNVSASPLTHTTPTLRERRNIAFVDQVPRLYNLAKGEDDNASYVVAGFEDYVVHQPTKEHHSGSQREKDKRSTSQTPSKESKGSNVKSSGSTREARSGSASQERESRRKERKEGRDTKSSPKVRDKDAPKDRNAKEKERGKEQEEANEASSAIHGERPVRDPAKASTYDKDTVGEQKETRTDRSHSASSREDKTSTRHHRHHHREHRSSRHRKDRSRASDSGTGSTHDKDKPCTVSVETVKTTERELIACPPNVPSASSTSPPFPKKPCMVVSPAGTEATAVTSTSTSDQRLPDNREVSALKEIVTNYQVPSMTGVLAEKSPSCTPTHSVVAPLPADLDRRVLDWVDNCVSQGTATSNPQRSTVMNSSTDAAKNASAKHTNDNGPLRDLQRSYLRLVDSEECSDLVIETEERPIRAHKAILFVRCPKLAQIVSADSSFWQLSWCCPEATVLFLRYLYAADLSFVPSVEGRVRKDLLTLCCQYQTDELAARLIRERSPSPLPFQLNVPQATQLREAVREPGATLLSASRSRKRCLTPKSLQERRARRESDPSSANNSDTGSSSGKKTRMSITCETVSVTAPTSESCHLIRQSPRLPQVFPCGQHNTPRMVTHISDEDDDALIDPNDKSTPAVRHVAATSRTNSVTGPEDRTSVVPDERGGRVRPAEVTAGSADQPIELGSSSDLFSDEDVVVGAIIRSQPPPPLSPIQPTPRRVVDEDDADREQLPSPPASLHLASTSCHNRTRRSASPAAPRAPASSVSSVMSSPSVSTRLLHRKSMSQPLPLLHNDDEDEENGEADDGGSNASIPTTPTSGLSRMSRMVESLDVTPLPRYSVMRTPEMHAHLNQYGIKATIGKRKAVEILKHIYNTTHPEVADARVGGQDAAQASSSTSDSSDEDLPLEETMVHDDDEEVSDSVEDKITRYIKNTPALHDKILQYEPLEVIEFKRELREHGIRVNDKTLINFLDFHCINISFGAQRKAARSPKKPRRRKTVRKPVTQQQRQEPNTQCQAMTQP